MQSYYNGLHECNMCLVAMLYTAYAASNQQSKINYDDFRRHNLFKRASLEAAIA